MNSRPRLYRVFLPAAVVLVLGLGVVLWLVFKTRSEANDGISALQSAYREQRPLEARLSDFNYAPAGTLRGAQDRFDYVQLDRAGRLLLGAVTERPSAESHRSVGQYYLATHELDKAIDQFSLALGLDPKNAKAHNDLGTALLEKGKLLIAKSEPDATQTFAASLQHFNQALEFDPSLTEAVFNRAFLCKHMKLLSEAEENWKDYLSKDSTSGWATEARDNLNAVQELKRSTSRSRKEIVQDFQSAYEAGDEAKAWQIVSSYHNRTGNVLFEELLDMYLQAIANASKDDTSQQLRWLSVVGDLAYRNAGDRYFSDQAQFYSSVSPARLETLKRARALMKLAHDGWGKDPVPASLEKFRQAQTLFEQAEAVGDATVAGYWITFCLYQSHQTKQGLATLQPLINTSKTRAYQWLMVRQFYLLSILHFDLTNYSQAIDLADQSLDLAEQTNDAVGKLNALTSLIEYNRFLSNYEKSLECIQRSLDLLNRTTLDPIQGSRHYGFIATSLTAAGWHDAAGVYQKEALRYAFETDRPATISYNLAFFSQVQARLKKFDEAEDAARRALKITEDQSDKDRMAYTLVQLGHVYRQEQKFDRAIESYDKAIELYTELKYSTQVYQAHKGRLFCYLAQGQSNLAEAELAEAVRLIESYRSNIFEQDNRSSFFDAEQTLFDAGMNFEYAKVNSPERAFDFSESSRARSLLDLINADARVLTKTRAPELVFKGATQSLPFATIRERIPDGVQVVQFAMLEDQLLVWVLAGKHMNSTAVPVKGEELHAKVSNYLRLITSPSESARAGDDVSNKSRELYDLLIKPVESFLTPGKQLCIVPDKILNRLPFGTLRSASSGEYLLDKYELMMSPSSTALVLFSEMAAHKDLSKAERIVSVGNPSFDHKAFPALPDLSSATLEARQVAGFYNSRSVLTEKDAVVPRVVSEMKNAEVLHFAVHSVLDERFPLRSKFLFATSANKDETADASVLFAHDIYDLKLPRVRLAVLSACETGAGRYFGGEGVMNMARPFLSAGVPLVVASLWPVESDATSKFMINFHKRRAREGVSVAKALQQAQRDMLHDPENRYREPYYWAPFVLIGGYARY